MDIKMIYMLEKVKDQIGFHRTGIHGKITLNIIYIEFGENHA